VLSVQVPLPVGMHIGVVVVEVVVVGVVVDVEVVLVEVLVDVEVVLVVVVGLVQLRHLVCRQSQG
jgi:hypothetical protein